MTTETTHVLRGDDYYKPLNDSAGFDPRQDWHPEEDLTLAARLSRADQRERETGYGIRSVS